MSSIWESRTGGARIRISERQMVVVREIAKLRGNDSQNAVVELLLDLGIEEYRKQHPDLASKQTRSPGRERRY